MNDETDYSEGAKIMVERIRSHPEEFTIAGRFGAFASAVLGPSDTRRPLAIPGMAVTLSRRDRMAIMRALEVTAEEAFAAQVVAAIIGGNTSLFQLPQPEFSAPFRSTPAAGNRNTVVNIGQGYSSNPLSAMGMGGTASNPVSYEQAMQDAAARLLASGMDSEPQQSYFGKLFKRGK